MDRTHLYALLAVAAVGSFALSKKQRPVVPQTLPPGDDAVKPKGRGRITTRVVPSR